MVDGGRWEDGWFLIKDIDVIAMVAVAACSGKNGDYTENDKFYLLLKQERIKKGQKLEPN